MDPHDPLQRPTVDPTPSDHRAGGNSPQHREQLRIGYLRRAPDDLSLRQRRTHGVTAGPWTVPGDPPPTDRLLKPAMYELRRSGRRIEHRLDPRPQIRRLRGDGGRGSLFGPQDHPQAPVGEQWAHQVQRPQLADDDAEQHHPPDRHPIQSRCRRQHLDVRVDFEQRSDQRPQRPGRAVANEQQRPVLRGELEADADAGQPVGRRFNVSSGCGYHHMLSFG